MEVLREAPKVTSFIPLVEHQSATPASFYNGPPVLHYYSDRCKVLVLDRDLSSVPALAEFASGSAGEAATNSTAVNGNDVHDGEQVHKTLEDVDIWVTSRYGKNSFALDKHLQRTASYYSSATPLPSASRSHIHRSHYMPSNHYHSLPQASSKVYTCSSSLSNLTPKKTQSRIQYR